VACPWGGGGGPSQAIAYHPASLIELPREQRSANANQKAKRASFRIARSNQATRTQAARARMDQGSCPTRPSCNAEPRTHEQLRCGRLQSPRQFDARQFVPHLPRPPGSTAKGAKWSVSESETDHFGAETDPSERFGRVCLAPAPKRHGSAASSFDRPATNSTAREPVVRRRAEARPCHRRRPPFRGARRALRPKNAGAKGVSTLVACPIRAYNRDSYSKKGLKNYAKTTPDALSTDR
jgi:hypothetical protein